MLIYNVTTQVSWNIHEVWKQWMQQTHIPAVLATGCFEKYQMLRLLDVDETEGATYAVQYYTISKTLYNRYIFLYADGITNEGIKMWDAAEFVTFTTLMEVIE